MSALQIVLRPYVGIALLALFTILVFALGVAAIEAVATPSNHVAPGSLSTRRVADYSHSAAARVAPVIAEIK